MAALLSVNSGWHWFSWLIKGAENSFKKKKNADSSLWRDDVLGSDRGNSDDAEWVNESGDNSISAFSPPLPLLVLPLFLCPPLKIPFPHFFPFPSTPPPIANGATHLLLPPPFPTLLPLTFTRDTFFEAPIPLPDLPHTLRYTVLCQRRDSS